MAQTKQAMTKINVVIQIFNDEQMTDACVVYLKGDKYRGIVVHAKTVPKALRKLAISIDAINQYRINTNNCD